MNTWSYQLDTDPEEIPDAWVWERLRARVRELLTASDFRVLPDVPWVTDSWYAYRQSLRDLADVTEDPRESDWPVRPQVEYPSPIQPIPVQQEVLPFEA